MKSKAFGVERKRNILFADKMILDAGNPKKYTHEIIGAKKTCSANL
jgi:hypothetical protein